MKNIIISTGGSGGHVRLAEVIYEYLKIKNNVLITIDDRGLNYFKKIKISPKLINFKKVPLKYIITIIPFLMNLFFSILKSFLYLKKKKINVVFSTGGYMSLPVCIAAKLLKIKIYLIEPNLVLGRSNSFLLKFSSKIFTYQNQIKNFPKKYINKINVIKPLIGQEIRKFCFVKQKSDDKFNLLIIGGSQGALKFDEIFKEGLLKLSKEFKLKVFHQASKKNQNIIIDFYKNNNIEHEVFSYVNNLHEITLKCDFVITRSGASTINELVFLNIPFLAIPFPYSKDDHQFFNADYFFKKNLCWLRRENEIDTPFLYDFLKNLITNKNLILEKKKNMSDFYKHINLNENLEILNKFDKS